MSSTVRTELSRRVEGSLDRLIAVTQRLVAVASPNPPSDTDSAEPLKPGFARNSKTVLPVSTMSPNEAPVIRA